MAITTPTGVSVTPAAQLLAPAMSAYPLQTALQNLNYLWRYHTPPLVDLCPTVDPLIGRSTIAIPILPSADGLLYAARVLLVASATTTFTGTLKYTTSYTGMSTTWTSWRSVSGAVTAGSLTTWSASAATLPANAVALQLDVQVNAGSVQIHHVLVAPSPGDAVAGIQPSGFIPFDDGMLGAAGAPVHTELLNRCKASTMAILRDRWQNAFSFAQVEGNSVDYDRSGAAGWQALPSARIWLPYQGPTVNLTWRVIASTTGGTTADRVRVRQVGIAGGSAVLPTFDADRTIRSGTLTVETQGVGAMRYADIALEADRAGVSDSTRLHAAMAWWRPGD